MKHARAIRILKRAVRVAEQNHRALEAGPYARVAAIHAALAKDLTASIQVLERDQKGSAS